MRKECLGSLTALLAGAGLGLAQPAPAPAVLASPAPSVRASGASAALPADLPPGGDATPANPSDPGVFPFPGAGVYQTPGAGVTELPAYADPSPDGSGEKGKDCDPARCHVWASADPLLWWVRPGHTPPLVTSDGPLDYGLLVGGRVAAGFVNAAGDLGLEAGGFWLARGTTRFAAASGPDGSPALGRPIYDALLQQPELVPVSVPGALAGGVTVASSSQLWGAETNVVGNAFSSDCLAIDVLGGLRYVGLDESLTVTQTGTSLTGAGSFGVNDSFQTRNQFFGGQLGSQVEMRFGRLYTNVLGKVAVGNVHQVVDVRGDTTLSGPGGSVALPGGLLALGTNAGRQTHDEIGVVPEVNFNVGLQLRPGIRLYAGYTFLYLNDVAHPGDQVNTTVNSALVPSSPQFGTPGGPSQPAALFNRTDYWAQGVNIGLALRY